MKLTKPPMLWTVIGWYLFLPAIALFIHLTGLEKPWMLLDEFYPVYLKTATPVAVLIIAIMSIKFKK